MANHKSALKRARQNVKHRERNQSLRTGMKTALKKALELITTSKTREEAGQALIDAGRALQKAASKGVIPRERASRSLSRIATKVNSKFQAKSAR